MEIHKSISLEAGTLRQLFWERFYRSSHPDIPVTLPCFLHFLKHGIEEGRDPNPFFQFQYIRDHYPISGLSNLEILLRQAFLDSINTSPYFDSKFYREVYADLIGDSSKVALAHYLEHGYSLGLRTSPDALVVPTWMRRKLLGQAAAGLTRKDARQSIATRRPILIVIPVYKDLPKTQCCLESLFASGLPTNSRVLVMDDACPEAELAEYLQLARDKYGFDLRVNQENLGFTETVNLANDFRDSGEDILILNSDTICPTNFVARLARYLDLNPSIATVTPLSNNATIATIPCIGEEYSLFHPDDVGSLDEAAYACSREFSLPNGYIEVPTGVGFCMLISHAAIPEGPLFDASLFGRGYGEEVHFCLESTERGCINVLAPDVFVWHYSGASFGQEKWNRIEASSRVINELHPGYETAVGLFCQHDRLAVHRLLVTLRGLADSKSIGTLVISHSLGGGIERYLDDRAMAMATGEYLIRLQPPKHDRFYEVTLMHRDIRVPIALELDEGESVATVVSELFSLSAIEVHSTVGHDIGFLFDLVTSLRLSYRFVLHDFASICPRIQPRNENNIFCGLPDSSACNQCLERAGEKEVDIGSWRHRHQWLLYGAQELIAPSRNTAELVRYVQPGIDPIVIHHESQELILQERLANQIRRIRTDSAASSFRVAVLGRLTPHKGLRLVEILSTLLEFHGVEVVVIGTIEGKSTLMSHKNVTISGAYKEHELLNLIEKTRPGVIFFSARWPETYSYTLSAALRSGYPVLAPDVGAFPERVNNIPDCALYQLSDSPERIIALLLKAMGTSVVTSATSYIVQDSNAMSSPLPLCTSES